MNATVGSIAYLPGSLVVAVLTTGEVVGSKINERKLLLTVY